MSEQEPRRRSDSRQRSYSQDGRRSYAQQESRRGSAPEHRNTRRRRRNNSSILLYVVFVIGVSLLLSVVAWVWANDILALNKDPHTAIVEIKEEDSLGDVIRTLKDHKLLFRLFVTFSGSGDDISPGRYELNTDMDYRAIITNIGPRSPSRQQVDVTIPEGYTIDQIFALLEENSVSTVAKLQEQAANHNYNFSFLQELPLGDYHRLEGYLFPDTYQFYVGQDPLYVINKMLLNFDSKVTDEMRAQVADSGYSLHDIVTIASMIEKETDGSDQRSIASVIFNRLRNPGAETAGYLQIDATLQYILPERKELLSDADKQLDSPYNTYLHKGLPAGPISNPGMASIYAAMNPENTGYYYYVLNPNTSKHEFSKTYREHQAKVSHPGG